MPKGCPLVCCELKTLDFTGRCEMCFSVENITEVTAWIVRHFPPKNQRAKISVIPKIDKILTEILRKSRLPDLICSLKLGL